MSKPTILPESFEHRSFVYRKFQSLQATWSEINGYATVSSILEPDLETNYAQQLALCDLSHLQRTGLKGTGTCEWLESQNIKISTNVNHAVLNDNGCLVARLGTNDILILDSLQNQSNFPSELEQKWQQDYSPGKKPCGFVVPRQESHGCFSVTGKHTPEMFAKLCAVDLRIEKFSNHMIAQTSLARLGAIIIRHDLDVLTNYLVLVESASAEYCWDCLLDAMQEFNGQVIGISALVTLAP